jgi:hypothetical protein
MNGLTGGVGGPIMPIVRYFRIMCIYIYIYIYTNMSLKRKYSAVYVTLMYTHNNVVVNFNWNLIHFR